ncbi:hypothetical protein BH11PLA1_BH11PLA1_04990 [soil metagenome]
MSLPQLFWNLIWHDALDILSAALWFLGPVGFLASLPIFFRPRSAYPWRQARISQHCRCGFPLAEAARGKPCPACHRFARWQPSDAPRWMYGMIMLAPFLCIFADCGLALAILAIIPLTCAARLAESVAERERVALGWAITLAPPLAFCFIMMFTRARIDGHGEQWKMMWLSELFAAIYYTGYVYLVVALVALWQARRDDRIAAVQLSLLPRKRRPRAESAATPVPQS